MAACSTVLLPSCILTQHAYFLNNSILSEGKCKCCVVDMWSIPKSHKNMIIIKLKALIISTNIF